MSTNSKKILITGATGQQGGATANELLQRGYTLRAMTRKPDSPAAQALAKRGVEVVTGDLDDPTSVERALDGMWGAYAVQNTWEAGVEKEEEQGLRFAELAKKKGIQHLVYSSVGSAHRNTGIPHFDNKWRIEEKVRALGFPSHVILRPVFFMNNLASPWFLPSIQQGQLAVALKPETVLQMIAVTDIGKYGAWAFEKAEALNGREIDLAGDQKTMPQTAEILSAASGTKIQFTPVPIEEVRKFNEDYALMLEWFDRKGYEADIDAISKESGIRPTSLKEFAATVQWTPETANR